MTIPTSSSLVQRIEAALSGSDLHSSEIVGLISAAEATASRLENLIAQLHVLLTALNSAEQAAQKPPQDPKLFGHLSPPAHLVHDTGAHRRE